MILLDRLYLLCTLLTALIGLISIKRHSTVFKLLSILLMISFVTEISGKIVMIKRHNNLPLYHLYGVVEYLFLTVIYSKILQGTIRKIVLALIAPMCAFALFNSFYLQGINNFPSNFLLICELFYMCYAFLGFRQMLLSPIPLALHKQSLFWLNLGQIIFSTTLFINFGLVNYLNSHHINQDPLYILNTITNLIYLVLLAIAIIKDGAPDKYARTIENN